MGATKNKTKKKRAPAGKTGCTGQPTNQPKKTNKKQKKPKKKQKTKQKKNGGGWSCVEKEAKTKKKTKKQKKMPHVSIFEKYVFYIQDLILYLFFLFCCSI